MNPSERKVATSAELVAAAADTSVRDITVVADLADLPGIRLLPGQTLRSAERRALLRFAAGQDGLRLTTDNRIEALTLYADAERCAVLNDTSVERMGCLALSDLNVTGVVRLIAHDRVRSGHVEVDRLHIAAADARGFDERPKGYGVEVIPGAFTLWNQHEDRAVTITADLMGLSAGIPGAPVRGSGIFVSGGGDNGSRLLVRRLETGAVYSDGGIAPGTPDRITGGVFVVSGAFVDSVRNRGPVMTYGANDMVLDNWGTVEQWSADARISSLGPSGIGFVNFGALDRLELNAPIETFGLGARGFNVYAGTVNQASFDRIVTHGDGAVGIQVSQPIGELVVRRGIETFGGEGDSLVKGVVVKLSAIALSIKPGGSARKIAVAGGLITHGESVSPLEVQGRVAALSIAEGPVEP